MKTLTVFFACGFCECGIVPCFGYDPSAKRSTGCRKSYILKPDAAVGHSSPSGYLDIMLEDRTVIYLNVMRPAIERYEVTTG